MYGAACHSAAGVSVLRLPEALSQNPPVRDAPSMAGGEATGAVAGSVDAEVVVAGGGIAGLATALALRRAGVARDVVVLERHAELRATGAALTIFPNGWFALRALGVGHKLTSRYDAYETSKVTNLDSGATQVFRFAGNKAWSQIEAGRQKGAAAALAEELPPGTIRFSSKIVSIDTEPAAAAGSSETAVVRLDDGTVIRAKVLIGCDGVHSVVARWMGMSEPVSSGRSAVRGLSVFSDGHGLKRELRQFLSEGLRAGMVPISDTEIYWFLVNNTVPAGKPPLHAHMPFVQKTNEVSKKKTTTGIVVSYRKCLANMKFTEKEAAGNPIKTLHEVTENLASHMPEEYLDVVRHSDHNQLSWAPLLYRNPWSLLTGKASRGAVTVAGDAFHPMTPDMAQGGCSALEDAIVLARALARAATPAEGIAAYVAERRWRVTWMVAGAYLSGWVQQGGTNVTGVRGYMVKWFRDWIFYRFVFPRLADTMWFNCGDLTPHKEDKDHTE
ncbi:hypothetical protein PR202_gb15688 [Eleusine coracana subsp. coracana]|uniref:FAD-binding domain-containing protein n=1 Tax=Eleusine coracana subsp. coracana TaxID=191504 RepID=A0AAV5EXS5_ELECO|nr:hypothetical protein PR202_gb15688 [Eleusine coracana subsp. coracana]